MKSKKIKETARFDEWTRIDMIKITGISHLSKGDNLLKKNRENSVSAQTGEKISGINKPENQHILLVVVSIAVAITVSRIPCFSTVREMIFLMVYMQIIVWMKSTIQRESPKILENLKRRP